MMRTSVMPTLAQWVLPVPAVPRSNRRSFGGIQGDLPHCTRIAAHSRSTSTHRCCVGSKSSVLVLKLPSSCERSKSARKPWPRLLKAAWNLFAMPVAVQEKSARPRGRAALSTSHPMASALTESGAAGCRETRVIHTARIYLAPGESLLFLFGICIDGF